MDRREGFLWGVFVSPTARRRGIGEALVGEAARIFADRDVRVLEAHVAAPNEGAIRFYRDVGFRVTREVGVLREGSDVPVFRVETTVGDLVGPSPASPARVSAERGAAREEAPS